MRLSAFLSATLVTLVAADDVASPVACAVAATLMGIVFVIMVLYYLFNWPDPDIRKYSYEVVSGIMSIFCAVLLFQSFSNTLESLMDGQPYWAKILAAFIHRFFWHAVLQVLLAYISKSICHPEEQRAKIITGEHPMAMAKIEMDAKCWGLLLAHMTGFGNIAAWGSVQQSAWFKQNWYYSWLVVPACLITNIPFLRFTDWLRAKIASSGVDDSTDKLEKLWDEEVEEAENDITALGLSFLTVQSVKFAICGTLANVEGEEEPDLMWGHTTADFCWLYAFGLACIPTFCYFVLWIHRLEEAEEKEKKEKEEEAEEDKKNRNKKKKQSEEEIKEEEEKAERGEKFARNLDMVVATFVMCMAWSWFYSTKWALGSIDDVWSDNTVLLTLAEAIVISVVCFSAIFALDKMADAAWTGDAADTCIKGVIGAIGILVGFSWEQCFDASVAALGSRAPVWIGGPVIAKQLMAIGCALLVVPAWKVYILPVCVLEGWRFGFIATHATMYIEPGDDDMMAHYFKQLDELAVGHKAYKGNPELRKNIRKILVKELKELENDDDTDYYKMPDLSAAH